MFTKLIVNTYKRALLTRHDPDGAIFYFSHTDFEGIECETFEFFGERGQRLQGYFYTKNVTRPDRLVIFEHGMGCGHRAYMSEIATLVEHGYTVFAYDHTGTLNSGGEHIGGFTQSLCDLDSAIKALKASGRCDGKRLAVIGHSWGGFSTMNIGAFHKDITHLVAMSGFVSPNKIITDMLGKMKKYAPAVFASEVAYFGGYAYADASLSLLQTDARALIIHSKDDPTVPYSRFLELEASLGDVERISFLPLEGKRHNPNYTADAVRYKDEFFAELTRFRKKSKKATEEEKREFASRWDWHRMTEQDADFWAKIFDFIDG